MRKEVALGIKEYLLWIAVLTLALTPAASASALPDPALYAGYNHRRARWGVSAHIYMMDTYVPPAWDNRYSEWDCIILSYGPLYWIQTGYRKWWWGKREFYVEKNDENNHDLWPVDGEPQAGHTYTYIIVHAQEADPHYWKVIIREGAQTKYSGKLWVKPYEPCDLQAKVESQDARIRIDGSHFSSLSYFTGSWLYWDYHEKSESEPYKVAERGHYEFYAYGGG